MDKRRLNNPAQQKIELTNQWHSTGESGITHLDILNPIKIDRELEKLARVEDSQNNMLTFVNLQVKLLQKKEGRELNLEKKF